MLKLLIREAGSGVMRALWTEADSAWASRLALVESRATLAAARRTRRLTDVALARAKRELSDRWAGMDAVEVDEAVVARAGDAAERHALRAYDAVHLTSALLLDVPDLVFATWDERLAEAASASGLAVAGV